MKQPIKITRQFNKGTSAISQREFLVWFLSLIVSTFLYLAIARLIIAFYHPDIGPALEFARKNFNIVFGMFYFAPEPTEMILFLSGALIYFFALMACYWLFTKILVKAGDNALKGYFTGSMIIGTLLVIVIGWLCLMAPNPFAEQVQSGQDIIGKINLDFYFSHSFISEYFYWYLLVIFPVLALAFFYGDRLDKKTSGILEVFGRYFSLFFCSAIIIAVFFISMYDFPNTMENNFDTNMVYYSVVQVFRGSPMLVDHFKNTYGLYPHFLIPVLKLTGLSMLTFTMTMAFLLAVCFGLLYYLLTKMVSNPVLILFGFTTVFFMSYMYSRVVQPYDSYFAVSPIRWLFPFLLAVFSYLYPKNRTRLLYFGSMVVFSLGIIWNPDFGLLTYIVLLAFFCYLEFDAKPWLHILRNIAFHVISLIGIGFLTFMIFGVVVKIFYGGFPAFGDIFTTLRVHALVGYGALAMPKGFHPYMLIALIFIVGILYSVRDIVRRKITERGTVIFVLTLSGVGAMEYYIGRSHNWTITVVFPWAFMLLTVYADDLLKNMRANKLYSIVFSLVLFVLSVSFFQTLYASKEIAALMFEKENKEAIRPFREKIYQEANFIKSQTNENEPVLIFMDNTHQGIVYGLSGTRAAINPGFNELYLQVDYERILTFLKQNESAKIFLDPQSYHFCDNRVPAILSAYYSVVSVQPNGSMMLLTKKKSLPRGNFLLADNGLKILHEQFTEGSDKRYKFSSGDSSKLTLGQQFSVQAIIKPQDIPNSTLTGYGTIFTNMKDSTGCIFQQYDTNRTTYLFAIHGKGMICPVKLNRWNYLAFTFNNGDIRGFSDGMALGTVNIGTNYLESDGPMYIGNLKMLGAFFFGDIYEIKISQGLISDKDILGNWDRVQAGLK